MKSPLLRSYQNKAATTAVEAVVGNSPSLFLLHMLDPDCSPIPSSLPLVRKFSSVDLHRLVTPPKSMYLDVCGPRLTMSMPQEVTKGSTPPRKICKARSLKFSRCNFASPSSLPYQRVAPLSLLISSNGQSLTTLPPISRTLPPMSRILPPLSTTKLPPLS